MVTLKNTLAFCIALLSTAVTVGQVTLQTGQFRMGLDKGARLSNLESTSSGKNYLPAGQNAPLLSIKWKNQVIVPNALQWNKKSSELVLFYTEDNIKATIEVKQNTRYISFDLKALTHANEVEWVLWGPFSTSIADTIGEVVGVVRNSEFAIGVQALNIKTLGGNPTVENDIQPSY